MARLPAVPILLLLAAAASAYLPPFNSPVATPAVQIGCDITYSQYTSVLAAITSANGAPPSFAPPTYQSDPLSCPLKTNCRAANPATPFTCWDGSCAASPIACNAAANFVCPASPIPQTDRLPAKTRCWDGSCSRAEPWVMRALIPVAANGTYGTLPACPPLPTCGANQIRCYDLSCQDAPSSGDPLAACAGYSYAALVSVCTALAAAPGNYSTGYQCCGQQSGLTNVPGICGTFRGCDLGQVMCRDGSCVNSTDYAAGACNTGCKAGEFRCYGKTKGNCTTNAAECPPPPATSLFVSEFVATVYPTTANATRLPLRSEADGSDLGWVDVPPVNAQGAVHWNVFNYMLGSQVSDPRRSLCSGDWDTCKYAPLQIFSPMVGIVSYDLLLYYAEGAATFDKTLSKAVDGWALEVALPVQLPANVKANKMCLAFVAYDAQGSVPQRGQGDWRCVDRNAVLADNSSSPHGPIYRGYAPLSLVMRGEPFTHFAFVHDVSDDFGPVESIGGGFFAAGIALLVVGGTFLLANREKLMGRIYNDGAGTSTSAM